MATDQQVDERRMITFLCKRGIDTNAIWAEYVFQPWPMSISFPEFVKKHHPTEYIAWRLTKD